MGKITIPGDGAPGAAKKKRGLSPEAAEAGPKRGLSLEAEATPDDVVPETERAAKRRCLPTFVEGEGSVWMGGGGGEEEGSGGGGGEEEGGSVDDRAALQHARPEMRGVGGNFAPPTYFPLIVTDCCIDWVFTCSCCTIFRR
jgi:hypothetical protein